MREFKFVRQPLKGLGDSSTENTPEIIVIQDEPQSEELPRVLEPLPEVVEVEVTEPLEISEAENQRIAESAKTPSVQISPSQIADNFTKETIETIIEKTTNNIENIANTALLIYENIFQAEFNSYLEVVGSVQRARDSFSSIINIESTVNSEMLINGFAREGESVTDSIYMLRTNTDLDDIETAQGKIYSVNLEDEKIEFIDLDSSNPFAVSMLAISESLILSIGVTIAGNELLEDLMNAYSPEGEAERAIFILGSSALSILKPTTVGQDIISQITQKTSDIFARLLSNNDPLKDLLTRLSEMVDQKTSEDQLPYVSAAAFLDVSKELIPNDLEDRDIVISYAGNSEQAKMLAEDIPALIVESLTASIKTSLESSLQIDMVDIGGRLISFFMTATEFNKAVDGVVLLYLLQDDRLLHSRSIILEVLEDITESYPEIFVRFDALNEYFSAVVQLMSNPSEFIKETYNEKWYYRPISDIVIAKFNEATGFRFEKRGIPSEEDVYKVLTKDGVFLLDELLLALGDGFNDSVSFVSSQCDRLSSNINVLCDETQLTIDIIKGFSQVEAANTDVLQTARDNLLEISAGVKNAFKSFVDLAYSTSDSFRKVNNTFDTGIEAIERPITKASEQELSFTLSPLTKGAIGLSALALLYAGARKIMK